MHFSIFSRLLPANKISRKVHFFLFIFFIAIFTLTFLTVFRMSRSRTYDCKTGPTYNGCVESYFLKLAEDKGTVYALAGATLAYKTDVRFRAGCHGSMHVIGRNAAREFTDASTAFGNGTFLCWSGYYHGVVEGLLRASGEQAITGERLNALCGPSDLLPLGSFARYHCTHALGHAIMYRVNNDLPVALTHCSSLLIEADRHRCALGAFMENYLADGVEHKTIWQPKEDLQFPCSVSDKTYAEPCYFVQGMFAMKKFEADASRSFEFCATFAEEHIQFECIAGVGKMIADITVFDHKATRDACSNVRAEFQEACFFGALQEIVGIDASMSAGETVCSQLAGAELPVCRNALTKVRATLGL